MFTSKFQPKFNKKSLRYHCYCILELSTLTCFMFVTCCMHELLIELAIVAHCKTENNELHQRVPADTLSSTTDHTGSCNMLQHILLDPMIEVY